MVTSADHFQTPFVEREMSEQCAVGKRIAAAERLVINGFRLALQCEGRMNSTLEPLLSKAFYRQFTKPVSIAESVISAALYTGVYTGCRGVNTFTVSREGQPCV